MNYFNEIDERFPMRRTKRQKREFIDWAVKQGRELGYEARVRGDGAKARNANIEFSDAQSASVIVTAHYDTPGQALFPNLVMPANPILGRVYAVAAVMPMVLVALGLAFGVLRPFATETFNYSTSMDYALCVVGLYLIFYTAMMLFFGNTLYANRHNRNDNTSGVAAVFLLMERLPLQARGDVAFMLFDNEEFGCRGSAAFAKANPVIKDKALVINLDCVGNGSDLVAIISKAARERACVGELIEKLGAQGMPFTALDAEKSRSSSDHKNFPCHVALMACDRGKLARFVTRRIHTFRDTEASEENVERVARALKQFLRDRV